MKKLLSLLLFPLLLLSLSACGDDEMIYDFNPVELHISVVDEQGNSLLCENVENSIVGSPIIFTEGSDCYPVDWESGKMLSRYYLPHFHGALYMPTIKWTGTQWVVSDEWEISFGELDGSESFDRTLKVVLLGQDFELRVTNNVKWKRNKPKIKRHYYLNGKELEDSHYTLVVKM